MDCTRELTEFAIVMIFVAGRAREYPCMCTLGTKPAAAVRAPANYHLCL